MKLLKGSIRRFLRGRANRLDPVVMIGKKGLSEEVIQSIERALEDHELIKIRFLEFKEEKKSLCKEIEAHCRCECVGIIGHVGIFYRRHPEEDKRKIELPD